MLPEKPVIMPERGTIDSIRSEPALKDEKELELPPAEVDEGPEFI